MRVSELILKLEKIPGDLEVQMRLLAHNDDATVEGMVEYVLVEPALWHGREVVYLTEEI